MNISRRLRHTKKCSI